MSFAAKAFITTIVSLGTAAALHAFLRWDPHDLPRFLCYLALAVPASCLKVRLPRVTGTMSVLFIFLLAGIAELGVPETILIGATCGLVQSFWRATVRPRAVQIVFTVANLSLAIAAAALFYDVAWLPGIPVQDPFRLALAASVFFLANTFPIATVIALTENKSVRQVWADCYCWTFPYYLVGAAIVGAFSFANRMLDWQAWVLILPAVYVIYRSYHLYLSHLEGEKRQAEEQRRHTEEVASLLAQAMAANARLDAVFQASPLAILSLDPSGRVSNWNLTAEAMFGWSAEEVVGKRLLSTTPECVDTLDAVVERTIRGERLLGVEVPQKRKDGSSFEAALWTAPLGDGAHSICGVLLTVADVSDRKRLEEQLRLSHKMEAVGRLSGGIAHDFNNLLTIINGYSTMVADEVRSNPYASGLTEEILNAGNRAADLVSQLMTFSRRQLIRPESLEINEVVREVDRMLSRLIGEHIEVRTVLDPDAGWIFADQNQMATILMNLATNARDAMPKGGVLSIETALVHVDAGSSTTDHDLETGEYVCLVVRDTGHGIDPVVQQHLFEPFFTTKARGKGTGLGLSSVYGGVQQNNGRIFVDTTIGVGTVFSIYLPPHQPQTTPQPERITVPSRSRTGETILLVEDETALRRMLRESLSKAGYRVWEAGTGADALHTWQTMHGEFDLVVTDVVMPVMNGLELANELTARCPGLRVIFMSGHAEDVITNHGVATLDVDLLPKPFLPEVLVQRVRRALDETKQTCTAA